MKCESCGEDLWNIGGLMYLHPNNKCSEKDGFEIRMIDGFLAKKFEEKYGKPSYDINKYKSVVERWIKFHRIISLGFLKKAKDSQ